MNPNPSLARRRDSQRIARQMARNSTRVAIAFMDDPAELTAIIETASARRRALTTTIGARKL